MINIFKEKNYNDNHRWDINRNADLCNILYLPGMLGNFLKFFLEKFSKLTPEIDKNPFNDIGTAHEMNYRVLKYSGKIQAYHASFIVDNKNKKNLNICQIITTDPSTLLYIIASSLYRAGNQKYMHDQLYKTEIKYLNNFYIDYAKDIIKLYNLKNVKIIEKFLVRDWLKLDFLEENKGNYLYKKLKLFENHEYFNSQKTFKFPLESFFSFDSFYNNIKNLDIFFNLSLDWNRLSEMKDIFNTAIQLDMLRNYFNKTLEITNCIDNLINIDIPELPVIFESYIYAHVEKNRKNKLLPLKNNFFKNTKEIYEYNSL